MATKELKNIFLSASIPFKERHERYFNTADIIAIRDSVIALSSLVIPKYRLIWGGHPSITPMIHYVLEKFGFKVSTLYIAQVKRKWGLDVREHYNMSKNEKQKIPKCPIEKEEAILEALKHFKMIKDDF